MATYRKRNNKWQVRIQRRNNSPISKTFVYKEDAKIWARQQEREIDLGIEVANQDITLKTLLLRYQREILPTKKHPQPDNYRINLWVCNDGSCRRINYDYQLILPMVILCMQIVQFFN